MTTIDMDIAGLVKMALKEDIGGGDITTAACVPPDRTGIGRIRAHASGVISGIEAARQAFLIWDPALDLVIHRSDGERVVDGDEVLTVSGRLSSIMTAERVALNFLCHLSGVATLTARFVEAVQGKIRILDTRKTLPGLRRLHKQAVVHGGGTNHRERLDSAILIKDNHLAAAGGIEQAVRRTRESRPGERIILEVRNLNEAKMAAGLEVEHLLLDNMGPDEIREIVAELGKNDPRPFLEISGGVTLETIGPYAETGADAVSVGALTHSAPALDLGLDVDLDSEQGPGRTEESK